MRGTNVAGGWVQWYNVTTGEAGRQWDGGFGVCFCFQGRGNGRVGKKISNKTGMAAKQQAAKP
ncbi:MAG: hypothetical protein EOM44_14925 [Bacteroidia bacterium]|nr:hypothetical protein [Bacteroidia bacterium]